MKDIKTSKRINLCEFAHSSAMGIWNDPLMDHYSRKNTTIGSRISLPNSFETYQNIIIAYEAEGKVSERIGIILWKLSTKLHHTLINKITEDDIDIEVNGSVSLEIANNESVTFISIGETSLSYYTQTPTGVRNRTDLINLDYDGYDAELRKLSNILIKEYVSDFKLKVLRVLKTVNQTNKYGFIGCVRR